MASSLVASLSGGSLLDCRFAMVVSRISYSHAVDIANLNDIDCSVLYRGTCLLYLLSLWRLAKIMFMSIGSSCKTVIFDAHSIVLPVCAVWEVVFPMDIKLQPHVAPSALKALALGCAGAC